MAREYVYLRRFVGGIVKLILGTLDGILRLVSLLLPIGLYMLIMQLRTKASSTSALSAYLTQKSEWQYVYSGTMMVMLEPNSLRERYGAFKSKVTHYFERNKIWFLVWIALCATAVAVKIVL